MFALRCLRCTAAAAGELVWVGVPEGWIRWFVFWLGLQEMLSPVNLWIAVKTPYWRLWQNWQLLRSEWNSLWFFHSEPLLEMGCLTENMTHPVVLNVPVPLKMNWSLCLCTSWPLCMFVEELICKARWGRIHLSLNVVIASSMWLWSAQKCNCCSSEKNRSRGLFPTSFQCLFFSVSKGMYTDGQILFVLGHSFREKLEP